MMLDLVDIIETECEEDAPNQGPILRRLLDAVRSGAQIDQQSDALDERMAERIAEIEARVRGAWKSRWCSRSFPHRLTADDELAELKRAREQERRRYLFGLGCVVTLRTKHIESIEWAIANAPDTPEADQLLESEFCRSFSILLADGTEVVPFRLRDNAKKVRAFKVSDGGNRNADALLVYDEDELRRYVVGLGFRVRCKTRDGTKSGLYTAGQPNRVVDTASSLSPERGTRQ